MKMNISMRIQCITGLLIISSSLFAQQKTVHKPGVPHSMAHNHPTQKHSIPSSKKPLHSHKIIHTVTPIKTESTVAEAPIVKPAANYNGQWRGSFVDNSTAFAGFGGQKIDYVLELETHDNIVTGYSYTYFSEGEKRFYTICKVKGSLNRTTKELTVTEFERTKFNTPVDFRNCFQTHKLKYIKDNPDEESLEGTWVPAPDQEGDCGFGRTNLSRKVIKPLVVATPSRNNATMPPKKNQAFRDMNKEPNTMVKPKPLVTKPPVKRNPVVTAKPFQKKIEPPVTKPAEVKKDDIKDTVAIIPDKIITPPLPEKKIQEELLPGVNYEKRNNTVVETINIKHETFTVDFYDDGTIDGDSISVFYNGRLLLSHQRLSDKPITLTLNVDPDTKINELVMYAENLGEIPPNTALMIVHDGDNRYEVRIVSDTEKNGTIRFTHIPK